MSSKKTGPVCSWLLVPEWTHVVLCVLVSIDEHFGEFCLIEETFCVSFSVHPSAEMVALRSVNRWLPALMLLGTLTYSSGDCSTHVLPMFYPCFPDSQYHQDLHGKHRSTVDTVDSSWESLISMKQNLSEPDDKSVLDHVRSLIWHDGGSSLILRHTLCRLNTSLYFPIKLFYLLFWVIHVSCTRFGQ